jgi:hypothetical protein
MRSRHDHRSRMCCRESMDHAHLRLSAIPFYAAIGDPVAGRGVRKNGLLKVLNLTCAMPWHTDDASPASIYHERDANPDSTFLVDEGDNIGLFDNPNMRKLFNAGHEQGTSTDRYIRGRNQKFYLFGRLAIAAIGDLPRPLISRSIVVSMQRQPPGNQRRSIDVNDRAWGAAQTVNFGFAEAVRSSAITLNLNPSMPTDLTNRAADNWRALISIGDALGHGAEARAAAVALSARRPQDVKVANFAVSGAPVGLTSCVRAS